MKAPYPEYGNNELCEEGRRLEAENVLMNELVSDQKRRIEELEQQVNRLTRALVEEGASVTDVRNLIQRG